MKLLPHEEYVEQAFFFQMLSERIADGYSTQEILRTMKNELLRTTNLPKAVDYLLADLRLSGVMNGAMARMTHYFTPFQTFIMRCAEEEKGRFDFHIALRILEKEANYLAEGATPQGIFFFQFESLSRNRLGFDYGLEAMSLDPVFNDDWRKWINITLRRQIGIIELPDLIYVRSEFCSRMRENRYPEGNDLMEDDEMSDDNSIPTEEPSEKTAILFGEQEGRIAYASRRRDPALFFAALARHLGYPEVPRQHRAVEREDLIPVLRRRIELLENKLTLLEEELHGGINLERFYVKDNQAPANKAEKQF